MAQSNGWSLEVLRGRAVGQIYALGSGETVVGNDLKVERGLNLVEQEGASPRKMAGRQAALVCTGHDLTIRDLETPGGTFVNQQRLLAGQVRRLVPGDVIQLGSVQVRVKQTAAAPAEAPAIVVAKAPTATAKAVAAAPKPVAAAAPTTPGRLATPFALAGGAQCRTWDDFLVLAAQKWPELRDELVSGRLAEYLRRAGRIDLVPKAGVSRSADDQLDDWLARVPATGSSAPELDVHPESVLLRVATGGGITRQTLRITNVGYRLLRSTARIEPAGTSWLQLKPEHDGRSFSTIDQTELPFMLELPETIDRLMIAQIVIESNGGSRRVAVRIERPTEQVVVPESTDAIGTASSQWREPLGQAVAGVRPAARILIGCAGAIGLRVASMLLNKLPLNPPATGTEPRLTAVAIILVATGIMTGLSMASRRGDWRDFPAAVVAGGAVGLIVAAFWFAVLQTAERILGVSSNSIWAIGLVSGTLGGLLALISLFVFPYRSHEPGVAR
jgi:hypothetical protein